MKRKILALSMTMALSMTAVFGCSSDSENTKETTAAAEDGQESAVENTDEAAESMSAAAETVQEEYDEEDYTRILVSGNGGSADEGVTMMESTSENTIYLEEDSVKASVSGVETDGTTVTITAPGTYIVTGTLSDGQIIVDCAEKGTIEIVLNNVDISNSTNSPVYIKDGKKVLLVLAENSTNKFSDADEYTYADAENEEPSACIFSKEDLVISGGGSLIVEGNFNNGIASKDTLKITGGNITVSAANNGIKGKDCLMIAGGTFDISAEGDGLKSDNTGDAGLGYITISGGTFTIQSKGDGIQAETVLNISGGTFTITAGDGAGAIKTSESMGTGWDFDYSASSAETEETASVKGIKAGTAMNLSGGTFEVDSEDDAFHSNGTFCLTGGALTIASGDDGIHADGALTVTDGTIHITQCYEGVESPELVFDGGTVSITASDDGVNAAGGETASSSLGQPGGMMSSSSGTLVINGGYIYIDADGDGLDSNGDLTVNGGTVIVEGPEDNGNSAVDYDGSLVINGGYLLASGSAGMVEGVSSTSTQNSATVYLGSSLSAGTVFALKDSEGNLVMAFETSKASACFIFSSPELAEGGTYTVYAGGTCDGTAEDGLYTDGTYTGGTEIDSFTISGTVTTAGSGSTMGNNMGGGQMGGNSGGMRGNMGNAPGENGMR